MADDVLLLTDDAFLDHDPGPDHPESPDRLRAILAELSRSPVAGARTARPTPATRDRLLRIHTPAHLERIEQARGRRDQLDPDTGTSPGSVAAAYLAAGAAVDAVTAVCRGEASRAFALVRPPGHHAEAERAMGFCLFNNVAVAAAHARAELSCERVMIVDWDVHHGNGTQHAFYARRDVLFVSLHRFPFYPGTGAREELGRDEGAGYTVNVPLPPGLGDADYAAALGDFVRPLADEFRPDLVLVSAGFDPHVDDPLGGMQVTHEGFAALCGVVREVADRHASGKLALVLEGGYDLPGLARSVHACVEVLAGAAPPAFGPPGDRGAQAIQRARDFHRRHWKLSAAPGAAVTARARAPGIPCGTGAPTSSPATERRRRRRQVPRSGCCSPLHGGRRARRRGRPRRCRSGP